MSKKLAGLAALALLGACGSNEPSGDLTSEESKQLNEAAAMLDDDNAEAIAVSEDAAANTGAAMTTEAAEANAE